MQSHVIAYMFLSYGLEVAFHFVASLFQHVGVPQQSASSASTSVRFAILALVLTKIMANIPQMDETNNLAFDRFGPSTTDCSV